MDLLLIPYFTKTTYSTEEIGGKAQHLLTLVQDGFNVPRFCILPVMSFSTAKGSKSIPEAIQQYVFSETFISRMLAVFGEAVPDYFAVRSSAAAEDGNQHSFAGQFETRLFVPRDQLEDAIRAVWNSAFTNRVESYTENAGLKKQQGIAVVIQEMISAEVSGVAFGMNPVTGNRKEKVVNAVFGLGEGLVSGELNADTYVIGECKTQKDIVEKTHQFSLDPDQLSGVKKQALASTFSLSETLNQDQLKKVEDSLSYLYQQHHRFFDIEFCFAKGIYYLLQARPITTVKSKPHTGGQQIVWDNSNIIESYPGITTPLTFSFIISMYEAVYIEFCSIMGVPPSTIKDNKGIFSNMLGLLKGRVYYNLNSWHSALALLPGYSINAAFMEKMMGVKEHFERNDIDKAQSGLKDYLNVMRAIYQIIRNHNTVKRQSDDFMNHFNLVMIEYEKKNLSERSSEELMNDYLEFEQTLVTKWKAPLVNDFFAMIYYGVLQKLVIRFNLDTHATLHNELISGAKDIISTEPVHRGLAISEMILNHPKAREVFVKNNEQEIWVTLQEEAYHEILTAIQEYLKKWGDRTVGELKLETITYAQAPESYIRVLKSYVSKGLTKAHFTMADQDHLRGDAERKVNEILGNKPVKKLIFNYVLKKARFLVSNRENLRFQRTRGFGMVRKIFIEMGNTFHANDVIPSPRDIFYLTKEEIFDWIRGRSVNESLKDLIELRKKEYSHYETLNLGERIITYGAVHLSNEFEQTKTTGIEGGELKGIGCCAGIVKGKVRIVMHPDEVETMDGDILVTFTTDPGWITLFPTSAAIIVERGSLLSHSAIVSREMGIPCIVGVKHLLSVLKTGDLIEMDGSTGQIKKLSSND